MRGAGRYRRRAATALAAAAAVLGVVALAHTSAARPVLRWLGLGSGCPMSLAGQTPASLEQRRVETMRPLAGTTPARTRPALGFVLGQSTRDEVSTWASQHDVACDDALLGTALRCRGLPADAVPEAGAIPIADAYFRFDPAGKLVALDVMHEGTSGTTAVDFLRGASERLTRDVGEPSRVSLETVTQLEAPYAQSSVEFRFRNYAADVSATNFGQVGVVVREQYRALD